MIPILFSYGPIKIYSFGFMVAAGVLLALFLMLRAARRDGFPAGDQDVMDLVFVTVISGFAGARLSYVLQEYRWYGSHPLEILAVWQGGLIFYGGAVAAIIGLILLMKVRGIPYLKGFDFLIPYGVITHAFGRIGCFLNGCCYGHPCHWPWAVHFPGVGGNVHPTQLYEAVFNLCLSFFLIRRYRARLFAGEIMCLYFMLYSIGRFLIECLRADNPEWLSLTINQWISIVLFVTFAGLYGLLFLKRSRNCAAASGKI
jgi:phosphatidylglycerol:prolipoprotein diacylglycerol transferase